MLGLAFLLGGAYLLVYLPLMWPVEGDSNIDSWAALMAPLAVIACTAALGLLL